MSIERAQQFACTVCSEEVFLKRPKVDVTTEMLIRYAIQKEIEATSINGCYSGFLFILILDII